MSHVRKCPCEAVGVQQCIDLTGDDSDATMDYRVASDDACSESGDSTVEPVFSIGYCSLTLEYTGASRYDQVEQLAMRCVTNGRYTASDLECIIDALPQDRVRVHQNMTMALKPGVSFTSGAFQAGGLIGLRNNTLDLPWVTAFLCQLVHRATDRHYFSSLTLLRNVFSDMHCDINNHPFCPSILIPLGQWYGGELWCEDVLGDVQYPGKLHTGVVKPIKAPFIEFNSQLLHGTFTWRGTRTVLAAYHIASHTALPVEQFNRLERLGFRPMPVADE